jgi:Protein of unknown function (DUF2726)
MDDRRKRISNSSERMTAERLREITQDHACVVFEKLRIADALAIDSSGLTSEEYGYALKAHFDFLVAQDSDTLALFAVEFDGPHHKHDPVASKRDDLKDRICTKLGMPILRIDSDHLAMTVGRFDLLPYLIDMWFMGEAFYAAQKDGLVPYDEDFDPYSIIGLKDGRVRRTFHPSEDAVELFHSLHKRGITRPMIPVILNGHDKHGAYDVCMALTYVRGGVLYSYGCISEINFAYTSTSQLAEDIALISLAKQIGPFLEGQREPREYDEIKREFDRWDFSPLQIDKDDKGLPSFWYSSTGQRPIRT